jgi:hypothetical protein
MPDTSRTYPVRSLLAEKSPLERRLLRQRLELPETPASPDESVPFATCCNVWLRELLEQIPFLHPVLREVLHRQLLPAVATWQQTAPPSRLDLVFYDGYLVTWTGAGGFMELSSGRPAIPARDAVETVGYALHTYFDRMAESCLEREKRYEHTAPPPTIPQRPDG